jgi:hypothetical protein
MTEWSDERREEGEPGADNRVRLGFDRETISLSIDQIVPLKTLREGMSESRKFAQIVSSIRAIGLVEAPAVIADAEHVGQYLLLDGHVRIEALKQLGIKTVDCLVANDDEAYSYNKRVNRLPPVQEHRMIASSIKRGVTSVIADALGLEVKSIRARFRLLADICPEAAEMLKDSACSLKVFDVLRQMVPTRQIESAELMIGQNNFTQMFARAMLAATPEDQLIPKAKKRRKADTSGPTSQQISRMERELAALQTQLKSVEESYGIDNLHLTFARGYLGKLLGNARIARWLSIHRSEYLTEFQRIAEIDTISGIPLQQPESAL